MTRSFTRAGRGRKRAPAPAVCTVLAAIAVCAVALVGCADDDATAPVVDDGTDLRLVVPDANIREPDAPCSGARAFRFAHPGAAYTIEDSDGDRVASGELPEGAAEQAFTFDMGQSRQPTVCVMYLTINDVPSLDGYALVIGDRRPVEIVPNSNLDHIPEAVLR